MLLLGRGLNLSQAVGVNILYSPSKSFHSRMKEQTLCLIQMEGLFSFMLGKLAQIIKSGLLSSFPALTDDLQCLFLGKMCQNKTNRTYSK